MRCQSAYVHIYMYFYLCTFIIEYCNANVVSLSHFIFYFFSYLIYILLLHCSSNHFVLNSNFIEKYRFVKLRVFFLHLKGTLTLTFFYRKSSKLYIHWEKFIDQTKINFLIFFTSQGKILIPIFSIICKIYTRIECLFFPLSFSEPKDKFNKP